MSYTVLNSPQGTVKLELDKNYIDQISNPNQLVNDLAACVEKLKFLTGNFPGNHASRQTTLSSLTFRQAGAADQEFTANQVAVWSPLEGLIKLNIDYLPDLIKAFNTSGYVIELVEALGLAALSYQAKDPYALSETSVQVLGRGAFYYGIARAVGFYSLSEAPVVSSLHNPSVRFSVEEMLGLELVRCYRKQRLGFNGNELLLLEGFETQPEPDISYGFLLELVNIFADWEGLREVLTIDVPKLYKEKYNIKDFSRNYLEEYNDFILNLSLRYKLNLSGLLNTWGFITNLVLDTLPEQFPVVAAGQPITVSERLLSKVGREVVDREVQAQYLPSISLGGFDSFGLTVSTGSALVLIDPSPTDSVSFKDLNCVLLGTPESNGPNPVYKIPYNLGDVNPRGHTLLVPEYEGSAAQSVLFEYLNKDLQSLSNLVIAKVIYLGTLQKYFPTIMRWGTNEAQSEFTFQPSTATEVPVTTYAVISKNKFGYNYIFNGNTAICQIISIEVTPTDSYQDDDDDTVYTPGGTVTRVSSVTTYRESTGLTSKEFVEDFVVKDSSGNAVYSFETVIPKETEPNLWVARERPPSNLRDSKNILQSVGHPVIAEKISFATHLIASSLAVDAKLNYRQSNKDIIDTAKKQYVASLAPSVQVVNLPIDFVNKVKEVLTYNIGNNQEEKINYRFTKLIEAYDTLLPNSIKERLKSINNQSSYTAPEVYGLTIQYPPNTQLAPDVEKFVSVENALLSLAKTSTSLPEDVRIQNVVDTATSITNDSINRSINNIASTSNSTTVVTKSSGFVRFINDGFAGLFETGGDPQNPWSTLNGTYFNNLVYLFESRPGQFLPVFNPKANPRASAKLISGLVEASLVALKVDPAISKSVEENLSSVLSNIAIFDRPQATSAWLQSGNTVLQKILNTYFPGEQAQAYTAVSEWLTNRLVAWANGAISGPAQSATDALNPPCPCHEEPKPNCDPGKEVAKPSGDSNTTGGLVINSVTPSSGTANTSLTVSIKLNGKLPPQGRTPSGVSIGNTSGSNIHYNDTNGTITANFTLPATVGAKNVSVSFPQPYLGEDVKLTITKRNGFTVNGVAGGGTTTTTTTTTPPERTYTPVFRKYATGLEGDLQYNIDYAGVIAGINKSYGFETIDSPELQGFIGYRLGTTSTVVPVYNPTNDPRLLIDVTNSHVNRLTVAALQNLSINYLHGSNNYKDVEIVRRNLDDKVSQAAAARFHAGLVTAAVIGAANKAFSTEGFAKAKDILEGFSTGRVRSRTSSGTVPLVSNKKIRDAVTAYKTALDSGDTIVGATYDGYPIAILNTYIELQTLDEREKFNKANPVIAGKNIFTINQEAALRGVRRPSLPPAEMKMASVAQIKSLASKEKYTFEVMPAIRSYGSSSNQGMQPPGAGHGISWKSSLNIAKLNVPGGRPIYQVMGINEEVIEFVGSFLGMRSLAEQGSRFDSSQFEDLPISDGLTYNTSANYYRAQQESNIIRYMQLSGEMLELTIRSYAGSQRDDEDQGIAINVKGYIHQFQRFIKSDDRVWYQISFRITDHFMKKIITTATVSTGTPGPPRIGRAEPFFPLVDESRNITTLPGTNILNLGIPNAPSSGLRATRNLKPKLPAAIRDLKSKLPAAIPKPRDIVATEDSVIQRRESIPKVNTKDALSTNLSKLITRWNGILPTNTSNSSAVQMFKNYRAVSSVFINDIKTNMLAWESKGNTTNYTNFDTSYFSNVHVLKFYNEFVSNLSLLRTYIARVRVAHTTNPTLELEKNNIANRLEAVANAVEKINKEGSIGTANMFVNDPSGFALYIDDVEKYIPTIAEDFTNTQLKKFLEDKKQILIELKRAKATITSIGSSNIGKNGNFKTKLESTLDSWKLAVDTYINKLSTADISHEAHVIQRGYQQLNDKFITNAKSGSNPFFAPERLQEYITFIKTMDLGSPRANQTDADLSALRAVQLKVVTDLQSSLKLLRNSNIATRATGDSGLRSVVGE